MEKSKEYARNPTVTSLINGGRRKIHATYPDKTEIIEEYDMKTHELLARKIKKSEDFKESKWVFEVGGENMKEENALLKSSSENPIFLRKDTEKEFQFRIRNLPYPKEVYIIETDEEKQQIVVKTTNKKYYKRIEIPELKRLKIQLKKGLETWIYKNNTLIISYPKPESILLREFELRKEFEKLNLKSPKEGDIECVQQ